MVGFSKGQRVRYMGPNQKYCGMTATVKQLLKRGEVTIEWEEEPYCHAWFDAFPDNLEPVNEVVP